MTIGVTSFSMFPLLASGAGSSILNNTAIRTRFEELEHYHRHASDSYMHRPIDALLSFRSQLAGDASITETQQTLDTAVARLHKTSTVEQAMPMRDRVMLASALYLLSDLNWKDPNLAPSAAIILQTAGNLAANRTGTDATHLGDELFHIDRDLALTLIHWGTKSDASVMNENQRNANSEVLRRIAMARAAKSWDSEELEFPAIQEALHLHYPNLPTTSLRSAVLFSYSFDYLDMAYRFNPTVDVALEEIIAIACEASFQKLAQRMAQLTHEHPHDARIQQCAEIISSLVATTLEQRELVWSLVSAARPELPTTQHGLSLIEFLEVGRGGLKVS